jgi:hypothetical protein
MPARITALFLRSPPPKTRLFAGSGGPRAAAGQTAPLGAASVRDGYPRYAFPPEGLDGHAFRTEQHQIVGITDVDP